MFSKLIFSLAVIGIAYACTDGKDNVVDVADLSNEGYNVHFQNCRGLLYDANGSPSCYRGEANLRLPGILKLVSGTVIVKQDMNLMNNVQAKLTLKKDSSLIGKVCENGKSKNILVPNKDCTIPLCDNPQESPICQLLEKAGTYDLSKIESTVGITGSIKLPAFPSSFNGIIKGKWEIGVDLVSSGKTVANIKLPSNEQFIYLQE
uniref:MD-2-related lipid-recognition domain-containing protein n=1 Tax=Strongyloides stercoralis TaxID=6248 RepID=A0A0K0EGG8_STRER